MISTRQTRTGAGTCIMYVKFYGVGSTLLRSTEYLVEAKHPLTHPPCVVPPMMAILASYLHPSHPGSTPGADANSVIRREEVGQEIGPNEVYSSSPITPPKRHILSTYRARAGLAPQGQRLKSSTIYSVRSRQQAITPLHTREQYYYSYSLVGRSTATMQWPDNPCYHAMPIWLDLHGSLLIIYFPDMVLGRPRQNPYVPVGGPFIPWRRVCYALLSGLVVLQPVLGRTVPHP